MASFLPQAQYEGLIHAAKLQFEKPPVRHFCVGCCAMYSCLFTRGVCFCRILYFRHKVTAFNKDASAVIAAAAAQAGGSTKLDMFQLASEYGEGWVDQNGSPLFITLGGGENSPTRTVPGGPPLGYNIVVNLGAPRPCWPPSHRTQPTPATHGRLLSVELEKTKQLELQVKLEELRFQQGNSDSV